MDIDLKPKQQKLLRLLRATGPGVPTVIGGGGAKGGGKSAGARNIAVLLASRLLKQYPGVVITIVRRVASDLRDNHIKPLFRQYPELMPYWRSTDHDLAFPGGGVILFRSAETKEDVKKRFLGGFESAIIIVDEAQQFDEEELQWIQTAARWTGRSGIPPGFCKTLLLFNPGGPGSSYIRRIFWTKQYEKENPKNFAFVHIFGWDNYEWFRGEVDISEDEFYHLPSDRRFSMFINDTSEGRKYDQFPPSIRAGYLLGSFDHFEGQYFAGAWDQSLCVVSHATCERLRQPWWTHWGAMDWGWAGPPRPHYSVFLWAAIGKLSPSKLAELGIECEFPLDVIFVYRSRHANLTPEEQWAQQVVDATPIAERESMARIFVDGAVFSVDRKSAHTTADLMAPAFAEAGLPGFMPADKDRIGGWRQLYNAFVRTSKARSAPVLEEQDGPLLFISAEVSEIAQGLPRLICDPDRPEDILKTETIEDDYGDCLRYLYKSMQSAQWEAPRDVRRRETYDRYEMPEHTAETRTAQAMAMKQFDARERMKYKRVKRR